MSHDGNAMSGESGAVRDQPEAPGDGDPSSGVLVDVPIPDALMSRAPLVAILAGFAVMLTIILVPIGGGFTGMPLMVVAWIVGGALAGLLIIIQRRHGIRRTRKAIDAAITEPLDAFVRIAIRPRGAQSAGERVRAMAKTLAKAGRLDATIRVCPEKMADPIEPTPYPFEPRPLENAHVGHDDPADPDASASAVGPVDSAPSAIRRNIRLKGGWFVVVMFGFAIALEVFRAIAQQQLHWPLFYWSAMFLIVLLLPARTRRWRARSTQCLLVPGGIIFRKSAWRSEQWSLHVFDRRRSVLCVFRHSKRVWMLTVADEHSCETAIGTREELHFVLRAWLSPLNPPGEAMLSDLR